VTVVEAMPAGRELDALVAERIFEWQRIPWKHNPEQGILLPPGAEHEANDPHVRWWGRSLIERVPFYSTDIAAAFEVVEKMHYEEFGCEIWMPNTDGLRYRYQAKFYPDAGRAFVGEGDTAPLAICRAALRAMEG
jgi:hypothetical protein